jgi:hypothetical protein
MASGISIGIAADTKAASTAIRNGVLEPLEDVEKALDGISGDSKDAGEDLESAMRGAQRATEDLKDENKELARVIQQEARKSSRAVKDIGDDGFKSASRDIDGFKDEATSNFAEVASSFDGSVDSMLDGVQGLTGGLASALTPGVGIPIAVLGAAAAAFVAHWVASAEETKQTISDMYDDMIESGSSYLSQTFIADRIGELVKSQDDLNRIREESKLIGEDESTILRANAGDITAVVEALAAATSTRDELNAAAERYIEANGRENAAITDQISSVDLLIGELSSLAGNQDTAASKANLARDAMNQSAAANDRATGSVEGLNSELGKVPGTTTANVNVNVNDAALTRIESRVRALDGRSIAIRVEGMTGPGRLLE